MIPSKDIGQVLRILGQNPTEDQIVQMVMKVSMADSVPVYLCTSDDYNKTI